jgi:hypothetical protein
VAHAAEDRDDDSGENDQRPNRDDQMGTLLLCSSFADPSIQVFKNLSESDAT